MSMVRSTDETTIDFGVEQRAIEEVMLCIAPRLPVMGWRKVGTGAGVAMPTPCGSPRSQQATLRKRSKKFVS